MSAEPTTPAIPAPEDQDKDQDRHQRRGVPCWCCDASDDPTRMVRLDHHPEVQLCLGCAHYVHQRAREVEDDGRRGPSVFARDRIRDLRAVVIRRGWHDHKVVGGSLRRLGRRLP